MTTRAIEPLLEIFHSACKPRGQERLGVETEKFGILEDGRPLPYEGPQSVLALFDELTGVGWIPQRETSDGPIISMSRGAASITLEPGGQFELSGAPVDTVHEVCGEIGDHLKEIAPGSQKLSITWRTCGFHPTATTEQLPWVPKLRYSIMREYFPKVGTRGLDMMRRTATAQVNVDYHDEPDAMRKLRVGLKLAPVCVAIFANSPYVEGQRRNAKSERALVWLDTDPDRTGLLPALWRPDAGFRDYVEWALDVPMYMFKRDGQVVANTGQTFRSFWNDGFEKHHADVNDWEMHLGTLFPEARLKRTIELRSMDSLPRRHVCAVPALWAGLLYDAKSLDAADQLTESWTYEQVHRLRRSAAIQGLGATFAGTSLREIAETTLSLARDGLQRRGRVNDSGRSEAVFLDSIVALTEKGESPSDHFQL